MDKQLRLWTEDTPATDEPRGSTEPAADLERDDSEPREAYDATVHEEPPRLITSGAIAQVTGQPMHRIRWILDTRPDIRPAAYAGIIRLYTQSTIARVRHELNAIDARRSADGGIDR